MDNTTPPKKGVQHCTEVYFCKHCHGSVQEKEVCVFMAIEATLPFPLVLVKRARAGGGRYFFLGPFFPWGGGGSSLREGQALGASQRDPPGGFTKQIGAVGGGKKKKKKTHQRLFEKTTSVG